MIAEATCARCGGAAPRNFLFCLACATGLTDGDPEALLVALTDEYVRLKRKLDTAIPLRDGLPRGRERDFASAQIKRWTGQLAGLAYVLGEWRP